MCESCVRSNNDTRGAQRVMSIANFSSELIDALMESDGEHKAVVFVDYDNDAFRVKDISYDAENKCIKIMLVEPYENLRTPTITAQIAEMNE